MEDYEDFIPIIEGGIEYTGVAAFKPGAPSPRTPGSYLLPPASPYSSSSQKKQLPLIPTPTRSGSFKTPAPSSAPRTQNGHAKSLTYPGNINYPGAESATLTASPWRPPSGRDIPRAPAKNRTTSNADASTPSPWGSAEHRHSHNPSLDSKSAPIRHLSFSRCSFKQVSVDIRRLRQLARQGSWKLLIERVKDAQRRGLLSTPDQEIAYGTYHLLALMKLQDFRAAAQEIAAFGDLNAPHYRYENHPELYPEKLGSMVPFALRCMHAELPHRVGRTAETLYRLYNLLAHCDAQIDSLQAERALERHESLSTSTSDTDTQARIEPVTEEIAVASLHTHDLEHAEIEMANLHVVEDESSVAESDVAFLEGLLSTWQRRKQAVCFSVVAYHMHQQQFLVALQWLDKLVAQAPSDPHVKTKTAFVQLQLGDVQGAQRTFSDVEALVSSSSSSSSSSFDLELRNLVRRNRGILCVALGQFPEAIAEFDAVLSKDPHDIVSTNNKALCLLYNQQLLDATDTLEGAIFKGPRRLVGEAVIANVCSMYEVVSFSGAAAKRSLRTWMKDSGPDDLEPTSFRLQ